jgi:hypothetical protein
VDPLLPRWAPSSESERGSNPFDRLRSQLEYVREQREDADLLGRLARRGDPLARAYAGLLRFAHGEERLPPLLVARYPTGEISYAPLARTTRESEIAVQQGDDPKRLLIGYLDWARRGYGFFATDRGLVCTGRGLLPPSGFVSQQISGLPYRFSESAEDAGQRVCPHLARREPRPYLAVRWPQAGLELRLCRRCARSDRQLLSTLTAGVAIPRPHRAFSVDASWNADCRGGPECVHARLPGPSRRIAKRYVFGRFSDAAFLDAFDAEIRPRLRATRTPTLVAGGVCFGSNRDAFVNALHPTAEERRALDAALPEVAGLFEVEEPSASQALERLWRDHAEAIVGAIVKDPDEARRVIAETRGSPGRVSELLRRTAGRGRERAVLDSLPVYRNLPADAAFVDDVARAYLASGPSAAERRIDAEMPREGKSRGIAWGLLRALGRESAHAWRFSDTERGFGESLKDRARELFAAPPESYDAAFQALLEAAGIMRVAPESAPRAPSP